MSDFQQLGPLKESTISETRVEVCFLAIYRGPRADEHLRYPERAVQS